MLITVGLINLAFWILATGFLLGVRRIPFYHPATLYLCYHFLGFVTRPFINASQKTFSVWDYIGLQFSDSDLLWSCFCTNLALTAFTLGCAGLQKPWTRESRIPLKGFIIENRNAFTICCLICSAIALHTTHTYETAFIEGTSPYEADIDDQGAQRMVGISGYDTLVENFFIGILILVFIVFKTRIWNLAILGPWILYGIWNGAGRWSFILPLITIVAVDTWNRGKKWPVFPWMILLICILFIFNILGGNRAAFREWFIGEYTTRELIQEHQVERGGDYGMSDFQEFEMATFVYSVVPERTGWSYGTQYLRLLIWPIPRQIWPDKPVFTSRINLNNIGNMVGLSLSMHADFYMIFGLPTLVGGMWLVGFFVQKFYTSVVKTQNPYLFSAYWIFFMEAPQWFRDGEVTIVYFFITLYMAVALCLWVGKVMIQETAEEEVPLTSPDPVSISNDQPTSNLLSRGSIPLLNTNDPAPTSLKTTDCN